MMVLVSYDVRTQDPGGARRLRRIAKACRDFGQRAQYSDFEIEVDAAQWVALKARLMQIIDPPRTASGSTTWANTGAARSNTSAQSPCWTSTPPSSSEPPREPQVTAACP